MDHPQGVLRTGDRATVQFEFISHPEYVKTGSKILFREGTTKVLDNNSSLPSPLSDTAHSRALGSLRNYYDYLTSPSVYSRFRTLHVSFIRM